METVIGFVAGLVVGSREGKEGLERLRSSWQAITRSPEVRRMAGEALSVAGQVAQRATASGLGGAGETIVRALTDRVTGERQPDPRAA